MAPALLASGRRTGRAQMYGGDNLKLFTPGTNGAAGAEGWPGGKRRAAAELRGAAPPSLRYRSWRICCVTAR